MRGWDPLDRRDAMTALRVPLRPAAHRLRVLRARAASQWRSARPDPVVVLGNHKAGTTAIAALLAEHLGERATLDMPALLDHLPEPASWGDFLQRYGWYFRNGVVKDPWLTFGFAGLRAALPGAQYVLVVRDPRANLRSILDRLRLPGDRSLSPGGLARLPAGWAELLRGAIEGREHYIEALARRWQLATAVGNAAGDELVCMRYEDFNRDKRASIAALAERLGRPGAVDISASVDRAYQPAGRSREADWTAFYGEANLARLERACGEGMRRFGYQPLTRES